ncbi:hypothetical protein Mal65_06850 [Crateriforma conspicua]|nr:hypothetical protein Mal65_06850 [Crateriforma conspicua]
MPPPRRAAEPHDRCSRDNHPGNPTVADRRSCRPIQQPGRRHNHSNGCKRTRHRRVRRIRYRMPKHHPPSRHNSTDPMPDKPARSGSGTDAEDVRSSCENSVRGNGRFGAGGDASAGLEATDRARPGTGAVQKFAKQIVAQRAAAKRSSSPIAPIVEAVPGQVNFEIHDGSLRQRRVGEFRKRFILRFIHQRTNDRSAFDSVITLVDRRSQFKRFDVRRQRRVGVLLESLQKVFS